MDEQQSKPLNADQTSQNEIKCTCCGAKLTFAPGTLNLKCEFCGTENEIKINETARIAAFAKMDLRQALYDNLEDQLSNGGEMEEIHTVKCQCCGAETTFEQNVISSNCDFCGAPLTVKQKETVKKIKPKALIPFAVDKHKGEEMFKEWLKGLWFAPSDLAKSAAQSESLSGIYLPFWTYDAKAYTTYTGRRGTHYYVDEEYKDSEGNTKVRQKQETRWTLTSGSVKNEFDDIVEPGSESLPKGILDGLQPWNLKDLVPYDERFMSGFKTETYSIDLAKGYESARKYMDDKIEDSICDDIGGDEQKIEEKESKFFDETFKHILMPIWISAFQYNGKSYRFVVNGQSGKIQGDRPYSALKIAITVITTIAAIVALFYFLTKK